MRSLNLPEIWLIVIFCITTCLSEEPMLSETGCQPDWEHYDEYCYYVSDTALRYGDAEADCENKGSTLTSIHSAGENTFIANLAGGQRTWIGFNDRNAEGRFTWVDGSQVIYINWDEGEPNGGDSRDCVILRNGLWRDNNCAGEDQQERIYICKAKECIHFLGMKNGTIPDSQITASSEYNAKTGANNARLDRPAGDGRTGAWSSKYLDVNEWIQVDLDKIHSVSGIVLQGRNGCCDQWVTKYKVQYSTDSTSWQILKDDNGDEMIFNGNSDRDGHVTSLFVSAIMAKYIRVKPQEWHNYISLRLEVLGCEAIPPSTTPATTTTVFIPPPTTTSLITTPTLETTSGHPLTTGSITHRSPEPQAGGSSTAIIIGAVVGSLLALLIAFVLLCFMVRKRRASKSDNPHTSTQPKRLAFVGPYDLTIDSQNTSSVNNQPIYANNTPQPNGAGTEKHPVYANTSQSVPPTEDVYQEIIETSTDEYCVQSKQDKENNVSIVYAKVENLKPDNLPGCGIRDCEGSGDIYSVVQDKGSRQDEGTEGWEENELYGTVTKDGNTSRDQEKADEEETEGWEVNELYADTGGHDTDTMDTEGWEENQMYGDVGGHDADTAGLEDNQSYGDVTGSTDYRNEGWEDNIIYAGSDN